MKQEKDNQPIPVGVVDVTTIKKYPVPPEKQEEMHEIEERYKGKRYVSHFAAYLLSGRWAQFDIKIDYSALGI